MSHVVKPVTYSQTWTFFDDAWHDGNAPVMGVRTHATWLASTVFDGARAFEGTAPDLDRHCARVNRSAANFGLKPVVDVETWIGLAREGIARFDANAELYVRPMYWAQHGAGAACCSIPKPPIGACASMRRRCRNQAAMRSRCRRFAGRPWNARRSTPRQPASIRTIRAR